jgi:hypothetical protein
MTRSVPPYAFGGTLSNSGETCAIFIPHASSPFSEQETAY